MNTLKELRKELHLTQSELAARLDVTSAAISRIESGVRNLTDRMARQISKEFGVSEEWLRTGEGDMFSLPSENERMAQIFTRMSADNICPWQRKSVTAIAEFILTLPAEALPSFRKLLADLDASLDAHSENPDDHQKDES